MSSFFDDDTRYINALDDVKHLSWQTMKDEPIDSYQAFLIYLGLSFKDRSIAKVAEIAGYTQPNVGAWAAKWHWTERAKLYYAEQFQIAERAKREKLEQEAGRWAGEIATIKEQSLARAKMMLEKADMLLKRVNDTTDFKISDIARLVDSAVKTARLAAELPADIIRTDLEHVELESLDTPAKLEAFIKATQDELNKIPLLNNSVS